MDAVREDQPRKERTAEEFLDKLADLLDEGDKRRINAAKDRLERGRHLKEGSEHRRVTI